MSSRKWFCEDCRLDTSRAKEHYFVDTAVWTSVHPSLYGMLCIGCLEDRLGRRLVPDDFPKVFINNPKRNSMSDRLRSRING